MYRTRNTKKQKILLEQTKRIFRTSDLSVLWGITNKNTLLTTIKRYIQSEILYRIHKGLYSTVPIQKLDKYELGCAVAGQFSYVSTETVLQNEGIIMQSVDSITLVGQKNKDVTIGGRRYLCRYVNKKHLLNRKGIIEENNYSIASVDRAVADILHFDPKYYFDNAKAIDNAKAEKIRSEIGYK